MWSLGGNVSLPLLCGWRPSMYAVFAIFAMLAQNAVLYWVEEVVQGGDVAMSVYATTLALPAMMIGAAVAQGFMLRSMQSTESRLSEEKLVSLSLVSMVCDAWCILDGDRDTVVKTDGRFDLMLGRPMSGLKLSDFLAEEQGVQEQFTAFQEDLCKPRTDEEGAMRGTVSPAVFRGFGGRLQVTMYAVQHRNNGKGSAQNKYLVGVSQAVEDEKANAVGDIQLPTKTAAFVDIDGGSVADTYNTAGVFAVKADANVEEVMDSMTELGRREHWLVEQDAIQFKRNTTLGSGSFGSVRAGNYCGAGVAVKMLRVDRLSVSLLKSFANEIRMLRRCRHPNLVQLFGVVFDKVNLQFGLVLELAAGDLGEWLAKTPAPEEAQRFVALVGTARGLWFLHSREPALIHGDLKSANVLVYSDQASMGVKLADFGLSSLGRGPGHFTGTLPWMAPEVARQQLPVSQSSDVFSFGRVAQHLAFCRLPHAGLTADMVQRHLKKGTTWNPEMPSDATYFQRMSGIMAQSCLSLDKRSRPLVRHVLYQLMMWDVQRFDDPVGSAKKIVQLPQDLVSWADALNGTDEPDDSFILDTSSSRVVAAL